MLRNRFLTASGSRLELSSVFIPQDHREIAAACIVSYDPARNSYPIAVYRVIPHDRHRALLGDRACSYGRLPLPSPDDVKVEIDYLFHILNTLQPYETQTQVPQDFTPVPDQSRRDPLLDDDEDFPF